MSNKSIFVMTTAFLTLVLIATVENEDVTNAEAQSRDMQQKISEAPAASVKYDPPATKEAPPSIREAVMTGYNIMNHTRHYAGAYVGNVLNCSNCHFKEGSLGGGKNGGLSLVGVTTQYPQYRERAKGVVDIIFRINSCFERSMNGKPLPPNSSEMVGLVTYFQWISKGLPVYGKIPWLGLKEIRSSYKPIADSGRKVFKTICSPCHGPNGLGTKIAPPLWGDESFNDGAGMAKPATLAAFVHNNMPYRISDLTEKQALDVAAFITSHPRAHFGAK